MNAVTLQEQGKRVSSKFVVSHGLTTPEADERLRKWGRNELVQKDTPTWTITILFRQVMLESNDIDVNRHSRCPYFFLFDLRLNISCPGMTAHGSDS